MTKKLSPKETVSFKEALMSEVIQSEALVNLSERKGVITKRELLEEIRTAKSELLRQQEGAYFINRESVIILTLTKNYSNRCWH